MRIARVLASALAWFERWLARPVPVLRIEILRIGAPLAILGFLASPIAHVDEWIGRSGFRVPDLVGKSAAQPLYVPGLAPWAAWSIVGLLVASAIAVSAGFRARQAAVLFALTTAFVDLSDRLVTCSPSKLAPVLGIALALSPCGARFGVDAWRRGRRSASAEAHVRSGAVRFVQVLLPIMYSASGVAKIRGDWVTHPHVLFTLVQDSLQTKLAVFLANTLPGAAWVAFAVITLTFETLAPVWFLHPKTRAPGLVVGLGMHAMIGLLLGPIRYFSLLMMTLLVCAYTPSRWLDRLAARAEPAPALRERLS
jgi:hypothetical protein